MVIKNLPLEPSVVYETIITTTDLVGHPNAASMGIMLDDTGQIILQPYCTSDTYSNIRETGICAINFTTDPTLFTLATLFQEELDDTRFSILTEFNVPILINCIQSFIIIRIINRNEEFSERAFFKGEVIKISFQSKNIQPFTRAFSLLIEILIHSSRVISFISDSELQNKIPSLLEIIENYSEIIRRITKKTSVYQILLDKILTKLEPLNRMS